LKNKNDPSNLLNKTPTHLLHYILEEGLTFSLRQLAHINGKIKKSKMPFSKVIQNH